MRRLGWTVEKRDRSDEKGSRGWSITPPSAQRSTQQGRQKRQRRQLLTPLTTLTMLRVPPRTRATVAIVHVTAVLVATTAISALVRRSFDARRVRRAARGGLPRTRSPHHRPIDTQPSAETRHHATNPTQQISSVHLGSDFHDDAQNVVDSWYASGFEACLLGRSK
jgi:hypothetical protein